MMGFNNIIGHEEVIRQGKFHILIFSPVSRDLARSYWQELLQQPFNAKNRGQNPARNVIPVKRQWVRITRISLW